MALSSKAVKKNAGDASAWMFNVVTSVGIMIVNKTLMATYGFCFAATSTCSPKLVLLGVGVCTVTDVSVNPRHLYCSLECYFRQYMFIAHSCTIAAGTNLSQFIRIGRFTAVSFQVIGHMNMILILIMGFISFGKEGLNIQVVAGMIIAVVGMIWYGNASSKPGGKERRSSSSLPTSRTKTQEHVRIKGS